MATTLPPLPYQPDAVLAEVIEQRSGSCLALARCFKQESWQHFGSGWIWLAATDAGKLEVVTTPNAGLGLHEGDVVPLLACDVWERACYIDHREGREACLDAFWDLADRRTASRRCQSRRTLPGRADRFGAALLDREPARASTRTRHPAQVRPAQRE